MTNPFIYLTDSYAKSIDAKITQLETIKDGYRLTLDKTVFYPMGGGQPTDQGTITAKNWKGEVYQALYQGGEVWHYLKMKSGNVPENDGHINAVIDWDRRYKNMKVHSAGHVVDFALYLLGYSPSTLLPIKGDHGKKPFIMYQGTVDSDIQEILQNKANELIEKDLKFSIDFQPAEALKKEAIYLQPGLPPDKPLRTLRLESVGAVADGGTQVQTTAEIGKVAISSVEQKDGHTIIRYHLI